MGPSVGGPLHRLGARRLRPPHRLAQIEVAFVCPDRLERLRAHHSYRTVTRSSATPTRLHPDIEPASRPYESCLDPLAVQADRTDLRILRHHHTDDEPYADPPLDL